MRHETRRFSCIALTLVLVCGALVGPVGSAAGQANDRPETYSVVQGDRCVPLEIAGDGSQAVQAYYDYRNGSDSDFSSHGTDDRQATSVSQLYVYRGTAGDSLIVLHDARNDGSGGGAVSMNITNIPGSAEWVIEDDSYPGNEDRFNHSETRSRIDWVWFPSRTDGSVLRGLAAVDGDGITIDARWGEQSYGGRELNWEYANNTLDWRARNTDSEFVSLSKDQPVTIRRGDCSSNEPPTLRLTATPANATVGQTVTFDASESTVPRGNASYRWDLDGDGSPENTTSTPTFQTRFESAGERAVTVTVVDGAGASASATETVTVAAEDDEDEGLSAALDGPANATVRDRVSFDASASTVPDGHATYYWDFDGDGHVDDVTKRPTVETVFWSAGEREVTVTVADRGGRTDTATVTVDVTDGSDTKPNLTARLDAPNSTEPWETVWLDASNSTGDDNALYYWDLDGDGRTEEVTWHPKTRARFYSTGAKRVSVTIKTEQGGSAMAEATVNVTDGDNHGWG